MPNMHQIDLFPISNYMPTINICPMANSYIRVLHGKAVSSEQCAGGHKGGCRPFAGGQFPVGNGPPSQQKILFFWNRSSRY